MAFKMNIKKPVAASAQSSASPATIAKATTSLAKPTQAFSFMKTGKAAKQMFEQEEAKKAAAKEEAGKLWRFWMPANEERTVTFLDGDLDDEGLLAIPYWHEHQIKYNGQWDQFCCTMEKEGTCPICDRGESKPYMIGAMTVIDHTPHEIQKGDNKGKIIQHRRKLYTPKIGSIKTLLKIAQKHGGLAGLTMEITRGTEDDPNVGSNFQIIHKHGSREAAVAWMMKEFKIKDDEQQNDDPHGKGGRFDIPNYEYEVGYKDADELVALGVGKAPSGPGYSKGNKGKSVDKKALADQM